MSNCVTSVCDHIASLDLTSDDADRIIATVKSRTTKPVSAKRAIPAPYYDDYAERKIAEVTAALKVVGIAANIVANFGPVKPGCQYLWVHLTHRDGRRGSLRIAMYYPIETMVELITRFHEAGK